MSVKVSWSPPVPLGDTSGYRIYYNSDSSGYGIYYNRDSSGSGYRIFYDSDSSSSGYYGIYYYSEISISGGSTNNYLLTGLQNGVSYTISIVGTSKHFFSDKVEVSVGLGQYNG